MVYLSPMQLPTLISLCVYLNIFVYTHTHTNAFTHAYRDAYRGERSMFDVFPQVCLPCLHVTGSLIGLELTGSGLQLLDCFCFPSPEINRTYHKTWVFLRHLDKLTQVLIYAKQVFQNLTVTTGPRYC